MVSHGTIAVVDVDANIKDLKPSDNHAEAVTSAVNGLETEVDESIPWWIILIAIIVAIFVLIIVFLILWKVKDVTWSCYCRCDVIVYVYMYVFLFYSVASSSDDASTISNCKKAKFRSGRRTMTDTNESLLTSSLT